MTLQNLLKVGERGIACVLVPVLCMYVCMCVRLCGFVPVEKYEMCGRVCVYIVKLCGRVCVCVCASSERLDV